MRTLLLFFLYSFLPALAFSQCLSGDCQAGNGILLQSNGERYIGSFQNSLPDGLGTYFYRNGDRYFGYWKNGMPDGAGVKNQTIGKTQRGLWRKGRLLEEDPQLVIEENGAVQQFQFGCISGNCADGNGVFLHPDGAIYAGDFKRGKKSGIGICYYPGQTIYRGNWENNLPNGRGTMIMPGDVKQAGFWEDGQLSVAKEDPSLVTQSENPAFPEKCLSGNCNNGYGLYQQADGRRYKGPFKGGKPNGNGVYYFTNGERYEGQMKDGILDGKGALYFPDGRVIRGYWQQGKYMASLDFESPAIQNPQQLPEPGSDIKVWAVIVGIATYEHMQALRFTDDDAYRFYAFLKSPEGGALPDDHIRLLIDESATRENIINSMNEVFGKAGKNDLIMLYFSGHGVPGAFLPIDFDGLNNKVYHQEISSILAASQAKYKVCIADACHSGGLFALRTPNAEPNLVSYYKNLSQAHPGTALIMSSKSNETSLEASGLRHGVFSHFLIRGLKGEADKDQNKVVTIFELYQFVNQGVTDYTGFQQSPVIRGTYDPKMPVAIVRE